jgi:hypothetical protein
MVDQILSIRALAQLRPTRPSDVVMMGAAVLATALAQAPPGAFGRDEACCVVSKFHAAELPIPETESALLLLEHQLAALRIEALPAYLCAQAVLKGVRELAYGVRSSLFDGFALPGLVGDEGTDFYPWLTEHELGGPDGAWARLADLQRQVRRRFEEPDLRQFPVRTILNAFQAEIFREDSELRHQLIGASLVRPYPKHVSARVIDDRALYMAGDLQHLGYDRRACAVILANGERLAIAPHRQDSARWLEAYMRTSVGAAVNIIIGSVVGDGNSCITINYTVTSTTASDSAPAATMTPPTREPSTESHPSPVKAPIRAFNAVVQRASEAYLKSNPDAGYRTVLDHLAGLNMRPPQRKVRAYVNARRGNR